MKDKLNDLWKYSNNNLTINMVTTLNVCKCNFFKYSSISTNMVDTGGLTNQKSIGNALGIGLGVGFGGAILLLCLLSIIFVIFKKKRTKYAMSIDLSLNNIEMSVQNENEYTPIQSNVKQISFTYI